LDILDTNNLKIKHSFIVFKLIFHNFHQIHFLEKLDFFFVVQKNLEFCSSDQDFKFLGSLLKKTKLFTCTVLYFKMCFKIVWLTVGFILTFDNQSKYLFENVLIVDNTTA
jgi:hypothetical protein